MKARDVTRPVGVFLIAFGVARLAELADWSRLHADVAGMLGFGSGTVTALLIAGKCAELLLTVLAVLALTRRRSVWLLVSLVGWTVDLALLAVVAAISDDLGRLLEHGFFFIAFAGLLAVWYVIAGRATVRRPPAPTRGPSPYGTPLAQPTRQDLPTDRRRPPPRGD